jgi:hypothetical protein
MLRVIAASIMLPGAALAQDWQPMTGSQITAALTDRDLVYENATQRFYTSGRTLYNAGRDSWGYWAVRGDQYCSQWPPADGWDCYDMAALGSAVRFIGEDSSTTDGVFAE